MKPLALMILLALGASDNTKSDEEEPANESLLSQLKTFFGISANPASFLGEGSERLVGDVWTIDLSTCTNHTHCDAVELAKGDYASPLYLANGDIVALEGNHVVNITAESATPERLLKLSTVKKLALASSDGLILMIYEKDGGLPGLATIALDPHTIEGVDYQTGSDTDTINYLLGANRKFGSIELIVANRERGHDSILWTKNDHGPFQLIDCGQHHCGDPSLSFDGKRVAFIKQTQK